MPFQNYPKLYVFLGAGGVGKTTLSASFALSLAQSGRKVGLLSIDPAKRLQSALGIEHIPDEGVLIPLNDQKGSLRACVLHTDQTLKRWVEEKGMSERDRQKLFANPYFIAFAEKIASAGDLLAAARVAEWVEQYPDTTDLVIDTAPGIGAMDFISKPEKVMSFLDGKLIEWFKLFHSDPSKNKQTLFSRVLKSGARKILDGFTWIGGKSFLINFGEFLILLDEILRTAKERLKYTRTWLFHPETHFILVTSVRNDTAGVAKEFAKLLNSMNVISTLCIINRACGGILQKDTVPQNVPENFFINFLLNYVQAQEQLRQDLETFSTKIVELPIFANLDAQEQLRMTDLCELGTQLRQRAGDILL